MLIFALVGDAAFLIKYKLHSTLVSYIQGWLDKFFRPKVTSLSDVIFF
jgi:hypothetical protein